METQRPQVVAEACAIRQPPAVSQGEVYLEIDIFPYKLCFKEEAVEKGQNCGLHLDKVHFDWWMGYERVSHCIAVLCIAGSKIHTRLK
jgi:hypothetical protein